MKSEASTIKTKKAKLVLKRDKDLVGDFEHFDDNSFVALAHRLKDFKPEALCLFVHKGKK